MKLSIFAIGRMKGGPERELLARYSDRIASAGPKIQLTGPEIREFPESRARDAKSRKQQEADAMLAALPPQNKLILLDEAGTDMNSQKFAELLTEYRDNGIANLCFVIGGADGLSPRLASHAARTISFGKLTWPHMLVRVLLTEQIYRAITIISGHPYHRS